MKGYLKGENETVKLQRRTLILFSGKQLRKTREKIYIIPLTSKKKLKLPRPGEGFKSRVTEIALKGSCSLAHSTRETGHLNCSHRLYESPIRVSSLVPLLFSWLLIETRDCLPKRVLKNS